MFNPANQSQQDDFINDPNLFLAVAMVKSISNLRDGHGTSSEEAAEDSPMEGAALAESASALKQADEMLEVTPILDLLDKLEFKKTLSVQEINTLITCIQTHFADPKNFVDNMKQTKEMLSFLHYCILNISTFAHHQNFIGNHSQTLTHPSEQSTQSRFYKEVLTLAKSLLDILVKKESEAQEFNHWFPAITKILTTLSSSQQFEHQYYRYMRQTHLRVDHQELTTLNQYLLELGPSAFGPQASSQSVKKTQPKKEEIVNLPVQLQESDPLEKALEYIPSDYTTLTALLQDHLHNKSESGSQLEEEEKVSSQVKQEESKDIFVTCKEHLASNKILECYSKCIDRLLSMTDEYHHYIQLDTSLFSRAYKAITTLSIKNKSMSAFLTKHLPDRTLKYLKTLHSISAEESSSMDVDQSQETHQIQTKEQQEQIKEQIAILGKSLEVLHDLHTSVSHEDKLRSHIAKTFEDIISESHGFSFLQTLVKTIKKQNDLQDSLLILMNSLIMHIFVLQKDKTRQSQKQISLQMQIVTQFIRLLNCLSAKKEKQPEVKKEAEKQEDSKSQPTVSSAIKTRSQLKKESYSTMKEQMQARRKGRGPKAEESQSATQKGKTPEKVKNETLVQLQSNLSKDEVLKTCISCLVMITPQYLSHEISAQMLMREVLENLIDITLNIPHTTTRVIQGVLAEFTKPTVSYSQDAQSFTIKAICDNIDIVLNQNTLTTLALRLVIFFKERQDLLELLGHTLIEKILKGDKKALPTIKTISDLYTGKALNRFLLFVLLSTLSNEKVKASLIGSLIDKSQNEEIVKGQNMLGYYGLLEVLLLKADDLAKFKPVIFTFLTKNSDDTSALSGQIDKIYEAMDFQYNPILLEQFANKFGLVAMMGDLRSKFQQAGKADLKGACIQSIKILVRITNGLSQFDRSAKLLSSKENTAIKEIAKTLQNNNLESATETVLNAKLQILVQTLSESIVSKQALEGDQLEIIQSLLELLHNCSSSILQCIHRLLEQHIDTTKYPGIQNAAFTNFLTIALNVDQAQNTQTSKILSLLEFAKQDEKATVTQLLDPILCARHIISHLASTFEENLYNHALVTSQEYLQLISKLVLFKSVFQGLYSLTQVSTLNTELIQKITLKLLQVKYDHKYLEYTENSSNVDNETNDKLLKNSGAEKLNNKDYMNIRALDKAMLALSRAEEMSLGTQDLEIKRLINSVAREIISSIPPMTVFKTNDDFHILNSYLTNQNNDISKLLQSTFRIQNPLSRIWHFATSRTFLGEESIEEEAQVQKKGGVQLIISFSERKGARRGAKKAQVVETVAEESASQQQDVEKVPVYHNHVSEKFIYLIVDLLKDNVQVEQHKAVQRAMKQELHGIIDITGFIQASLTSTNASIIGSFKKLFISLMSSSIADTQEKQQMSEYLNNQLVTAIQNGKDLQNEEAMLTCLELALVISTSNTQLVAFIRQCILPQNFKSNMTKLLILDFLCQLAMPQYSKAKESDSPVKYSPTEIQEKRQMQQIEKLSQKKKKTLDDDEDSKDIELKKSFQQEGVEGYKQDRVLKADQNYERYMERVEEQCTFTKTKKDFAQQHWYFCYTCGLTGSNGCCAVCARKCHKGHHVIYSRKSNFFCDCGESGNCKCLAPEAQAARDAREARSKERPSGRRGQRQEASAGIGGFIGSAFRFANPSERSESLLFGGMPRFDPGPMIGLDEGDMDDEDAALIIRQFGGINSLISQADREGRGLGGRPIQILSESSEDDMLREENEDDIAEEERQASMRGLMSIFNRNRQAQQQISLMKKIEERKMTAEKREESSASDLSQINPVEDPLSGASTPHMSQSNIMEKQQSFTAFGLVDQTMTDEESKDSALSEIIDSEKSHFEQVFTSLLNMLDEQIHSQMEVDQSELSRITSPLKRDKSNKICQPNKTVTLCQDLGVAKKHLKEGAFQVKPSDSDRNVTLRNLNLHSCVDSTKEGLVAVCEGDTVNFYPSAHFFEEGYIAQNDQFQTEVKEGENYSKVETQKLGFAPLHVKFNPVNQTFLAVAGTKDLQVLTLNSKGKVQSRLVVDIMLEAFGRDMTILNVEWVPGSQTMIAVGTNLFVKIYELSEDNMCPTHNLMLLDDQITTFTMSNSRPCLDAQNKNKSACDVIIGSKNGLIYVQEVVYSQSGINKSPEQEGSAFMNQEDNSQIFLTQVINVSRELIPNEGISCVSLYFAPLSELLFASFEGGLCISGKVEKTQHEFYLNGFKITPFTEEGQNQALKAIWQKNGEVLCSFKELGIYNPLPNEVNVYISAMSRKLGSNIGFPCLIKISENGVDIQMIKPANISGQLFSPPQGISFIKNSLKNSKIMRLLALYEDGTTSSLNITHLPTSDPKVGFRNMPATSKFSLGPNFGTSLILRSELPKEVQLPVNFFEKMKNAFNQADLRQQMVFSGDIINYFKGSRQIFDHLSKANTNQPVITEGAKKSIKMHIKLENADHVITGIRVRVDPTSSKPSVNQSLKVLSRVVKFVQKGAIWYDIPLCDAEVIFAAQNALETEFITEDPKNAPIRIYSIEVFVLTKKEFNYKEKVRKIEKVKEKSQEQKSPQTATITNEEAIKREFLNTRTMPLVSWKEKNQQLSDSTNDKDGEVVLSLDVITQVVASKGNYSAEMLQHLLAKLKGLYKESLFDTMTNESVLQAAIMRCMRVILQTLKPNTLLGDPLNYETLKDSLFVEVLTEKIISNTLDLSQVRNVLKELVKIYKKRHYQLFRIVEGNPDMITQITSSYLKLLNPDDSSLSQELSDILSIIFAQYTYYVNQYIASTTGFEAPTSDLINHVYGNVDLTKFFSILAPFILHKNESVQKITFSRIFLLAKKYAKTMFTILKTENTPQLKYSIDGQEHLIKVMIVDFSPHLISYLLSEILPSNQTSADVAYSMSYKLIKTFEYHNTILYKTKSDLGGFLLEPIKTFITTQLLTSAKDLVLYETKNEQVAKYIYSNFVLTNLLLQSEIAGDKVKLKQTNLGLDAQLKQQLVRLIISDESSVQNLIEQGSAMLKSFHEGFKGDKCSIKSKYEDGVAIDTYDAQGGQNNGGQIQLLRPVIETSPWKWHPLFLKTNGIFDLLDRKIPVQLLLTIQFLLADYTSHSDSLLQPIIQLTQAKPAKTFLGPIGSQVATQILLKQQIGDEIPDEQKQVIRDRVNRLKAQIKYKEFFGDFEILYNKFIKRNLALSFNMQFHLHQMLEKTWKKASQNQQAWQEYLAELPAAVLNEKISMLFQSAFSLNDDSATLCLALSALGLEKSSADSTIANSYKLAQAETSFDLAKVFSLVGQKAENQKKLQISSIDLVKLVDVLLLGKNKKSIRIASAHLLKGLYESSIDPKDLVAFLVDKIPSLKQYGVNSQELLATLGYVVNAEANKNQMSAEMPKFISEQIYKAIDHSNSEITAHPNLDLYATLQKISSCFSTEAKQPAKSSGAPKTDVESAEILKQIVDPQMFLLNKANPFLEKALAGDAHSRKITNPYMLEIEACSKCYEQKSLPFQTMRFNEIKSETKFTDSCQIIKFNATYLIKSINVSVHDIRGTKVVKTLNIFVNNKQGVDLADMRNNWSYWKRVKQVHVEVGQKLIDINFTLPIHATNILIEFQTINLAKPIQPKQPMPVQQSPSSQSPLQGLDTISSLLPKSITSKLSIKSQNGVELAQGSSLEKELLYCPRCGKQVQGRHGNCNSCGENALQCTFCRNINYEKLDAFLCNECGLSRYAKFDFTFQVKQGYAAEKIENEDQKNNALQQIETLLQTAQSNYSQLMKKRQLLSTLVKKLNEGYDGISAKPIQDIFGDECATLYQGMMKALNTIKILKVEINQYIQGQQNVLPSLERQASSNKSSNQDTQSATCFSCIQEHLKASLSFLEQTSTSLKDVYSRQGFLKLLYTKNLKMHTQSIQEPARRSICAFLAGREEDLKETLEIIEKELFSKKDHIPAHLLAQNIVQESYLALNLLDQQLASEAPSNAQKIMISTFWKILMHGFKEGEDNSAIAEQIVASFLAKLREVINKYYPGSNQEEKKHVPEAVRQISPFSLTSQVSQIKDMVILSFTDPQNQKLNDYFSEYYSQFACNWLIYALIMKSSARVRDESKEILTQLMQLDSSLSSHILKILIESMDQALDSPGNTNDQFFDTLSSLLSAQTIKEKIKDEQDLKDENNLHVRAFRSLFAKVDKELHKLLNQERQKESLGNDGFMPSISMGQSLSRLVTLISLMIKESEVLKTIVQQNVTLVIKSFLKIRKLNLTKNKTVSNCEVEIEKMFKELHSEKTEEKEKFIIECMKIIETGECDSQEQRFLFEEICKVIDPVKPDPVYTMNLNKAPSQEFFLRGKMSKNPYTTTSLGKTMGDARQKICKELELAEPELMELIVAGKIIGTDLSMKAVYEQVWWPHVCRQRNPDEYDIPPIDEAAKSSLTPMNVTYRLAGIDGEATEDRVETLQEGEEAENLSQQEAKFQVTKCLLEEFQGSNNNTTNGISVLLRIVDTFGALQDQKYMAEQLLRLLSFAVKNKKNRQELVSQKNTVSLLARRLFESVGMQSENQRGPTLFDTILNILESLVTEMNLGEDKVSSDKMEVDQIEGGNEDAATHIELFLQIMEEACNEMLANHQGLDKTSKKIRAVSKILPFLINKEDTTAIEIIREFVLSHLEYQRLDQAQSPEFSSQDKFRAQFYFERSIEMLDSTPIQKDFIKDTIFRYENSQEVSQMSNYLTNVILLHADSENEVMKHKLAATYILKLLNGLIKNHPPSQALLLQLGTLNKIYELSQGKFKDKTLTLIAQEIVENMTNKNHKNDEGARNYLQNQIDQANKDKKDLAAKKREAIMKQMQAKKTQNKFLKQIGQANLQEEEGPKCIVCQDGYSKKPTEVLGMYVFCKKAKVLELSASGSGFTQTIGYSTVTHSNFIHFTCHQNAYRVDSGLRQPKKEWEGAAIRNDHTKCNNLFPLKGGKLGDDAYINVMDRYFQILVKSVGQCDNDKAKVVLHDFKLLLNRFAYEDSFSRDTHGGGPEHNMHLVPFMIQMLTQILKHNPIHVISHTDQSTDKNFTYIQERKLAEFLEAGIRQKKDFLTRLEEEKKFEEIEEEEKFSESMSSQQEDEEVEEQQATLNNLTLDQISYFLTIALVFCQMPRWEQYKLKFLSIILCTVVGLRDDKQSGAPPKQVGQQTDYATGKKLLIIGSQGDVEMQDVEKPSMSKRKRLMSDNKVEILQRALFKLRPLLVQMRMVDQFKIKWDAKRLGMSHTSDSEMPTDVYLQRLNDVILTKDNLAEVIGDCDEMTREYKERTLKIGSVEEFLQDLNLLKKVQEEHGSVEQFVMAHF